MSHAAKSAEEGGGRVAAGVSRRRLRQAAIPYLFLAPFTLLFVLFLILPLAYAFGISVFADRLVGGTVFVGLENYSQAFGDAAFWAGVRRMVLFGIFQVPIMLALALIFALLLDSGAAWFTTVFRLGFFIPYAVPSVVAALIWGYLYGPTFGPFSQIAGYLDLPSPAFLSESWMLASIANIVTWEFTGYNMIILYSALQAVPKEVREAGAVDGAREWQIALYVRIPLIFPALLLTGVFSIIGTFQLFNEPSVLQANAPGVIGNNYTPNLYAYTLAFTNQDYNYSAAVSFALGAVVVVFSYVFMLVTNRREAGR
ncbi:MAG: sugar ABC transporter permease [Actinomycetota bacterium]|nr:sugar ABC transporter permease [Actinomycetota bacterium]